MRAADDEALVELVALDEAECLRLLAGSVIGRVVFSDSALPAAHPVTYLLDGEEVVFRTGGGSKLAVASRNAVVAFEVDEIDTVTRTGWSVLGVGVAYEVVVPERLTELADRMPRPWAPNRRAHTIAVPLQRLTGRRLVRVPPAAADGRERGLEDRAAPLGTGSADEMSSAVPFVEGTGRPHG